MLKFTVFFLGDNEISPLYLSCMTTHNNLHSDYVVYTNKKAEAYLTEKGFTCIDYATVVPSEKVSEIESLISEGNFTAASDIVRLYALFSKDQTCYIDADIHLDKSVDELAKSAPDNSFSGAVENGGFLVAAFMINNRSVRARDYILNRLNSVKKYDRKWGAYGRLLLEEMAKENISYYVVDPVLLMSVHWRVWDKVFSREMSIDFNKFYHANPRALGVHVCKTSSVEFSNNSSSDRGLGYLYSSDYYKNEFKESPPYITVLAENLNRRKLSY